MADPETVKFYTYKRKRIFTTLVVQFMGILAFIISFSFAVGTIILTFVFYQPTEQLDLQNSPFLTGVCLSLWISGIGWFVGSLFLNYLPVIWIGEAGIYISHYLFFKIFIPWIEVVDVIEHRQWFFPVQTFVLVRKISLYHHIANSLYFHLSEPCFIIADDIEDKDKLISSIRSKALFNSEYYQA